MNLYNTTPLSYKDKVKIQGEKLFYKMWNNSSESFEITVDSEVIKKKVIIQQHVNPLNEQLEDRKLICLDKDLGSLTWGSIISGYDNNEKYMVITKPYSNDVYSTCKVRKLNNSVLFSINDTPQNYLGILSNSMLYTEKAYTGDTNVFDEEDKKALAIPYDNITKNLKLFDEIVVDNVEYKIVLIDTITLKEHDEERGVLQLVLLQTNFGKLTLNLSPTNEINGILRFARLKERVYNSLGREILTPHGILNTGDYITQEFIRGTIEEKRTYIVRSRIDKRIKYDSTFVIECLKTAKLLDKDGVTIHTYPVSFQDNKSKMSDSDRSDTAIFPNSSYQAYIKFDNITHRLAEDCEAGKKIDRIMISGFVYKITGRPDVGSMVGIMTLGLDEEHRNNNDNLEFGIADYNNNISLTPASSQIVGYNTIEIGKTEEYSMEAPSPYSWNLIDTTDIKFASITNAKTCIIECNYNTNLIGQIFTLQCIANGMTYKKQIQIVELGG